MDFDTVPASNFPITDLVLFLNQGFEEYFVPIQFNTDTFLNMLRKDGIDLTASRVLLSDDQPSGIALIARRGWMSRLAAMGISKGSRGRGAGSWFMEKLIDEARQRSDHEMVLEVIEQNEPAVRLYRRAGFEIVRRLIGCVRKDAKETSKSKLDKLDLREMGRLISIHGFPELPWQLSGETIALMTPPAMAYCNDQAYIAVSNPEAEHVVIWSLLVEQNARGNGFAVNMLRNVMSKYTGRTWHVPAVFPQEFEKVLERAGFKREELSQWQMKLAL